MENLRKLEWNEEYAIKFILNGHNFSTPTGKGFQTRFETRDEVNRLKSKGAINVKAFIRKWN